jgi:L-alanine-DL-glutamate epimerase-like enolase superfamily enzyme
MKVTAVETHPVLVKLEKPIGSALGQIHSFGCILVTVRTDAGISGENLIFTLNGKRTKVLRQMVDELADLIVGRDAGHIADFWTRAWKDINFLGHKGVPVAGISALDGALWDALGKASHIGCSAAPRRRCRPIRAADCGFQPRRMSWSPRPDVSSRKVSRR